MGISERELLELIKQYVATVGTQKVAAQKLGISPQYLNDVLRSRREISFELAQKFGYLKESRFKLLPPMFASPPPDEPEDFGDR